MKNRPLINRTTDELKTLLKEIEHFEFDLNDAQKERLNEIRYELNMRLNPVMRMFQAAAVTSRLSGHVHAFEMLDCARPMVCDCGEVQP